MSNILSCYIMCLETKNPGALKSEAHPGTITKLYDNEAIYASK